MDYSNWTFTAIPKYTTLKEGINKITAKYSCLPEVNFTKFYSVNVTGVVAKVQNTPPTAAIHNTTPANHDSGNAFPPSLPSVNPSIVSEFKHSKILKSSR
jgi:hypothetical protein